MLNSKQRAKLKSLANKTEAIMQIGKLGVSPEVAASADEALESRELIKISVLDTCEQTAREAAEILSGRTRSEIVTVIGRKIVLYRKSKTNHVIEL